MSANLPKSERNSRTGAGPSAEPSSASRGQFDSESGSQDTAAPLASAWEVGRDDRSPRLWRMLAASLVFHAFLTPGPALLGLVAMLPQLDAGEEELVEVDLTALPIGPTASVPEEAPPEAEEPTPAPAQEEPAPEEQSPNAPPANEPEPERDAAPQNPVEPNAPGPTQEFGDPVALAGDAGQIADSNANVRLVLFNDVVREHPLGLRVGELLERTPQWRDFFGPSGIDPVRDIDRVLIAGPQLRNSSQVVAVVQHGLGKDRIRSAFENLVARKGQWIDQESLLAKARADRADRIFAAPNDRVVVVAPPNMQAQVAGLSPETSFPASAKDVAVTAYIIKPSNVTRGIGIQLPETIKWARFDVRPLASGGAIIKVLAEDVDAEHAENHSLFFQTIIEQAATMDPRRMGGLGAVASFFGVKKQRFIERVEFKNDAERILGTVELTKDQLTLVADILEGLLPAPNEDKREPGGASATGATPSAPTPAPQPSPRSLPSPQTLQSPQPPPPQQTPEDAVPSPELRHERDPVAPSPDQSGSP